MVAVVLLHAGSCVQEAKWLVQDLPEARVVAAIGEDGRSRLQTLGREPVEVDLLDNLRAGGGDRAMFPAIVVTDTKVAAGDHVIVEVSEQVVDVLDLEVGAVIFGAQQTILLSTPPGETELVLEAVLLHGLEDFEDQASAGG